MTKVFGVICAWLLVRSIPAGAALSDDYHSLFSGTQRSLTGQFVIHDAPASPSYLYDPNTQGGLTNLVHLKPALLAVSCERIKKALLDKISAGDGWKGQIVIDLHHFISPNEPLLVAPQLFGQNWIYRLELPDRVDRSRLISAIVEVLLLEMADRNSSQAARIPEWLTQGLTREIQLSTHTELLIDAPATSENGLMLTRLSRSSSGADPLSTAYADLRTLPPLTMAELSWPGPGQLDGSAGEIYRSSAQFFVHELLLLPNGPANLRNFIQNLSAHLNWQLTFLQAFHANFRTQLDVEKWWALRIVEFTGRDLSQAWPGDETWRKLDEIVRPIVDVRARVSDLPMQTAVSLQSIIRDWERTRQLQLLQEKSRQLFLLRLHASQDLVYLVDAYRQAIDDYLRKRDGVVFNPVGRTIYPPRVDPFAREAIARLDDLDARRQQSLPQPKTQPKVRSKPLANISFNN